MVIAVITEDGLDQFCETKAQANREKRDLENLGCSVRLKTFKTWEAAESWEDQL